MHRANCITKTQPCYRYSRINYSTEYKIYRVQPHRETRRKKQEAGSKSLSHIHKHTKRLQTNCKRTHKEERGSGIRKSFGSIKRKKKEFSLEVDVTRLPKGQQEKGKKRFLDLFPW